RTAGIVALLTVVAFGVAIVAWRAGYERQAFVGVFVWCFGVIGAVIGNALTIGTIARRIYRQQRGLSRTHELSWDDDSLTVRGEDGQSTTRWSEFHKAREVDDLFILFLSDAAFLTIPKRAFPDEPTLDAFRARMLREVRPR
ncbi:MAG: YcxB family protein, partial [Acidobacteria bacterium]|nr:YcxB family protein [Acidobacteriota bacterium]